MPDVNVLLYATNLDARQRGAASRWLEAAFDDPAGIGFAWAALCGFLRLSTMRGPLPTPLSLDVALGVVDGWLAHPHARIIAPGDRHAALLGRLLIGAGRGGNLVSDAHLAAIAIEHGATLGSFDADFERFAGLRFEHLVSQSIQEP
ncbi:MAG: TA system VapC family ribonuclease toxin [Rhodanobacteraceae bacterium]